MCAYLKNIRCFNAKSSTYYFHMKTKTSADFEICISVPLTLASGKKMLKVMLSVDCSSLFEGVSDISTDISNNNTK